MKMQVTPLFFLACALLGNDAAYAADAIVIGDFEGTDYGHWKVVGTAFGTAPARGTLPGQMHVNCP